MSTPPTRRANGSDGTTRLQVRAALRRACPGALQLDLCDAACLEVSLARLSSLLDANPDPNLLTLTLTLTLTPSPSPSP